MFHVHLRKMYILLFLDGMLSISYFFNGYSFLRDRLHERGRGWGGERERIWSRLQALSCQHRTWHRAWTHELWDHDLSQSWVLNQLSHLGTPGMFSILTVKSVGLTCHLRPLFLWFPVWMIFGKNLFSLWQVIIRTSEWILGHLRKFKMFNKSRLYHIFNNI